MVKENGYTLIEVLVASALFAGLSVILTTSLFSILGGRSKAEIIKEIRQNGAQAMNQVIRRVAGASAVDCGKVPDVLTITTQAGQTIKFKCDGDQLTQGGYGLLNTDIVRMTSCSFSCDPAGNNQEVGINFTLEQQDTSARQEERSSQEFSENILVRNE